MSYWLMKPLSIGGDTKALDPSDTVFPVFASRKLDGIRGCVYDGKVLSNSKKPLASRYIQERFSAVVFDAFDGEFIYGDPADPLCYNKTQSAVNSIHWPADLDKNELRFHVFDMRTPRTPARDRLRILKSILAALNDSQVVFVEQTIVYSMEDIEQLYQQYLAEGYEGLMLKRTDGFYKEGRSGKTDQPLLRMKPFGTEFYEAQIVGYECAYENQNDLYLDEQGFSKRSSHKENKVALDMLGSFVVQDVVSGIEFRLPASKMPHHERISIWKNIDDYVGRYVRYTCLAYGTKEKPRMPSFRGFRSKEDLGLGD